MWQSSDPQRKGPTTPRTQVFPSVSRSPLAHHRPEALPYMSAYHAVFKKCNSVSRKASPPPSAPQVRGCRAFQRGHPTQESGEDRQERAGLQRKRPLGAHEALSSSRARVWHCTRRLLIIIRGPVLRARHSAPWGSRLDREPREG